MSDRNSALFAPPNFVGEFLMKQKQINLILLLVFILNFSHAISLADEEKESQIFNETYWWTKVQSESSKATVLLEIMRASVEDKTGAIHYMLQTRGSHIFYSTSKDKEALFEKLILTTFQSHSLEQLKSFYSVKETDPDGWIAEIFQRVFSLHSDQKGFCFHLRSIVQKAKASDWVEKEKAEQMLTYVIQAIDDELGPELSHHVRARIKNQGQEIFGSKKVAIVIKWELIEVTSTYDPEKDDIQKTEAVKKSELVTLLKDSESVPILDSNYGTKDPLPFENGVQAETFFNDLLKHEDISRNPSPKRIKDENWIPIEPLFSGIGLFINSEFVDYIPGQSNSEAGNLEAILKGINAEKLKIVPDLKLDSIQKLKLLILPELEKSSKVLELNMEGTNLKEYVSSGGILMITGLFLQTVPLLNEIFNFSITLLGGSSTSLFRKSPTQGNGPNEIKGLDATYPVLLSSLPKNGQPLYSAGDQTVVAKIPYGKGIIFLLSWDFFNAAPVGIQNEGWLDVLKTIVEFANP